MSAWGFVFLACIALAPFTFGLSLLIPVVVAAIATKPRTYTGEELDEWRRKGNERVDAYLQQRDTERDAKLQSRIQSERAVRERQEREIRAQQPSAYAWYRCSNAMCRHRERLLTWHGDSQECENCGRSTYREV